MAYTIIYPYFVLLIGGNSLDLFNYFGVDSIYGYTRTECMAQMAEGHLYIDALALRDPGMNALPRYKQPYLFVNTSALLCDRRDIDLFQREIARIHHYIDDLEDKERLKHSTTFARSWAKWIYMQVFEGCLNKNKDKPSAQGMYA